MASPYEVGLTFGQTGVAVKTPESLHGALEQALPKRIRDVHNARPADWRRAAKAAVTKRRGSKNFDHKVLTGIGSAVRWAAHSDGLKFAGWGKKGEGVEA